MRTTVLPRLLLSALAWGLFGPATVSAQEPLPSWNDTARKQAIVAFVERVTTIGGPEFVPVEHRVAVFDQDGTLWTEQPMYVQLRFALDRVKALAPEHPEWKRKQPFRKLLRASPDQMVAVTNKEMLEIVMATHAGMTTDEFEQTVREWLATARHPRFDRPYTECVYQPMLELLSYLRGKGFKTFIVSGGGVEFMRVFVQNVYGVPPEQTVGSSIKLKYEMRENGPVLFRVPEIDFVDDKDGKPVGIHKRIGRRPLIAFGNSDGDLQMLQWTAAGSGPRLSGLVHHTDGVREWAYDRNSAIGRLDEALNQARTDKWTLVDMKLDWKVVYPFEPR